MLQKEEEEKKYIETYATIFRSTTKELTKNWTKNFLPDYVAGLCGASGSWIPCGEKCPTSNIKQMITNLFRQIYLVDFELWSKIAWIKTFKALIKTFKGFGGIGWKGF